MTLATQMILVVMNRNYIQLVSKTVVSETFSQPSITTYVAWYNHPPPGSPPCPSASALPANATYGNTNGLVPTSPKQSPNRRRSPFTKWLLSVILFYVMWHTSRRPQGRIGGSAENNGVFTDLMSKPIRARRVEDENGIYFVRSMHASANHNLCHQ
jgi:hypothetical protein